MDEADLRHLADQIIIEGATIHGCDLPQTDFFATRMSDRINKFLLKFGYDNLTLEEIILAMEMNAQSDLKNPLGDDLAQIQFHGRFINVFFIAGVLKNYMVLRNNLDRKITNQLDGF